MHLAMYKRSAVWILGNTYRWRLGQADALPAGGQQIDQTLTHSTLRHPGSFPSAQWHRIRRREAGTPTRRVGCSDHAAASSDGMLLLLVLGSCCGCKGRHIGVGTLLLHLDIGLLLGSTGRHRHSGSICQSGVQRGAARGGDGSAGYRLLRLQQNAPTDQWRLRNVERKLHSATGQFLFTEHIRVRICAIERER